MAIHTIIVPNWHPTLLNTLMRSHPMKAARYKREDADMLRTYALLAHVPPAQGKRRVEMVLTGWKRGRMPDPDAFHKSTLDGLVTAGLLLDDAASRCEASAPVLVRSPTLKETRIVLTDLE